MSGEEGGLDNREVELDSVLRKLNTVYPGMLNPDWSFEGFKMLDFKQLYHTHLYVRVDPGDSALIQCELYGLDIGVCKRRFGLGVLAKERLPPPEIYGLSLSCLPRPPGDVRLTRRAWLHLSGEPVVFGQYGESKFGFSVPLEELEAIVDALANAPTTAQMVFRS